MLKVVSIPSLKEPVLTGRDELVSIREELHCHYTGVVSKQRLVAVAKVQSPNANVLVSGTTS